jgi:hypothetical protein
MLPPFSKVVIEISNLRMLHISDPILFLPPLQQFVLFQIIDLIFSTRKPKARMSLQLIPIGNPTPFHYRILPHRINTKLAPDAPIRLQKSASFR